MNNNYMNDRTKHFPEPSVRYPFYVEQCGLQSCSPSYHITRTLETSNVYVAEYIISGKGTLVLNGLEYHPEAGDFYLLQPGTPHEYYTDPEDPWVKIYVNCYGALCENLVRAYGLSNTVVVQGCDVFHTLEELYQYACEERPTSEVMAHCAGKFTELLALVSSMRLQGKRSTDSEEVNLLCDYMDQNTHRMISIAELCHLIYRSPDYTIKLFKREIGSTPYDYQLMQKMNICKRLLCTTGSSISRIGPTLGYDDPQHFSKLFRKKCGMSPREYRNQFRTSTADHEPWISRPNTAYGKMENKSSKKPE